MQQQPGWLAVVVLVPWWWHMGDQDTGQPASQPAEPPRVPPCQPANLNQVIRAGLVSSLTLVVHAVFWI
jgi:hypothetical protein